MGVFQPGRQAKADGREGWRMTMNVDSLSPKQLDVVNLLDTAFRLLPHEPGISDVEWLHARGHMRTIFCGILNVSYFEEEFYRESE